MIERPTKSNVTNVRARNHRFALTGGESASNKIPRQINRSLIFNEIRKRQPVSRADLARTSGLQRSTVSLIVEELIAERWIIEGSTGKLPRGRRPTFLNVNHQRGVLALDIHPSDTTIAIADAGGRIVFQKKLVLPENPLQVVPAILKAIDQILSANKDRTFDGVGISLPGRLHSGAQISADGAHSSVFAPNIRWPLAELPARVEQTTGLRVAVDNVANACALSEIWFGDSDNTRDVVVVNVSEGIGTGIFANGRIVRGKDGSAGEFGHVQLDPNGIACGCGSKGCWETMASNRAALRYYAESARRAAPTFEHLLELADAADPHALEALSRMCSALGRGMHMIASALAPAEIIVVGDLTQSWERAGPLLEASMLSRPLASTPRLRPAQEGKLARLRSSVALIMFDTLL